MPGSNNIKGQIFERLTVLERLPSQKDKNGKSRSLWLCQCSCGNSIQVILKYLRNGHVKSCGCLKRDKMRTLGRRNRSDLVGQVFGKLSVLKQAPNYTSASGKVYIRWVCRCECGNIKEVTTGGLKSGTKSCGCLKLESRTGLSGEESPAWKGGKYLNTAGYVMVRLIDHPRSGQNGYVLEHILVMEKQLSRNLRPKETVHHINGVKNDNRPENLELWSSSQPSGQRMADKIKWAKEILQLEEDLCMI